MKINFIFQIVSIFSKSPCKPKKANIISPSFSGVSQSLLLYRKYSKKPILSPIRLNPYGLSLLLRSQDKYYLFLREGYEGRRQAVRIFEPFPNFGYGSK